MKAKKGISLIVLVITIVVIIILAAAVMLSINDNNPFDRAREAVDENDKDETQSAINLLLGNIMSDIHESVTISGTSESDVLVFEAPVVTSSDSKSIYFDSSTNRYTKEEKGEAIKLTPEILDIDEEVLQGLYITSRGKVVFENEANKGA